MVLGLTLSFKVDPTSLLRLPKSCSNSASSEESDSKSWYVLRDDDGAGRVGGGGGAGDCVGMVEEESVEEDEV